MNRRAFLTLGAVGAAFLAGCPAESQPSPQPATDTAGQTAATTSTRTPSATQAARETPSEPPDPSFLAQDGDDTNPGTRDAPIRSIQEGINRARAGDTIQVKPGRVVTDSRHRSVADAHGAVARCGPEPSAGKEWQRKGRGRRGDRCRCRIGRERT
jgi:hypothetical protein